LYITPEGNFPRQDSAGNALFPQWGTRVFRLALALGMLSVIAMPAALMAWERSPFVTGVGEPRAQPVKFDHRHHVRDDGMDCTYCHADVRRSPSAGMPAVSVCMGCHAQVWPDSPELEPVRAAYFGDATLAWERVTRLPHFVFFDHSSHVNQGVACASCHGRIDSMPQVYAVNTFTMKFCLDCHRSQAVAEQGLHPGTDCTTCHR
jgi:hypothetical protein